MTIASFFNFEMSDFPIQKAIQIVVLIVLTGLIILIAKRAINRSIKMDVGRRFAVQQILKYFLLVIAASLFLQIIGIDVSVIVASSAALLVGLGMGVQHLFSDLVSGFIVLLDGTIKVGDIIELEGMIAKVKLISLRTTTVETRTIKI